jgi:hypothetical protein
MLLLLTAVNLKKLWRCDIILWHSVHSKIREKAPDYSHFEGGIHRQYSNFIILFYTFFFKKVMKKIRKELLLFSGILKQRPDI